MEPRFSRWLGVSLSLAGILLLMVTERPSHTGVATGRSIRLFPAFAIGARGAFASGEDSPEGRALLRVAERLARRIARQKGYSPPLSAILPALREQHMLLRRRTEVTLALPENPEYRMWDANMQAYPGWLAVEVFPATLRYRIDAERIRASMAELPGIVAPRGTVVTGIREDGKVQRVLTSTGAARPGVVFDSAAAQTLASALAEGAPSLVLPLLHTAGTVENAPDVTLGPWTLLGSGKSDFRGSPAARISNVRKALNEQVNNVLVPPGETFSFNATLGGPITESRGWKLAKVIFNTTDLVLAPGGGICQVSTTTFRAMLRAGFTPVKRANHSMYVSYYEKYGVGIDATVFPGQQDLTFVNDTSGPLLLQAYDEGTEANVQIYGTPDGRETEILGPYFASSDLTGFPDGERPPRGNEIAWVQNVLRADGRTDQHVIVSRYTALPRSLAKKYDTLRASAPAALTATVTER